MQNALTNSGLSSSGLQLLTLILAICSALPTLQSTPTTYRNTYHITAGNGSGTGSLTEYLQNHTPVFFESSTRLVFSPGVHELRDPYVIFIADVTDIALIGRGSVTVRTVHYDVGKVAEVLEPETVIRCQGYAPFTPGYYGRRRSGFTFFNVTNLTVRSIAFSGCGGSTNFNKMRTFSAPP